jgi:hypothetical protein
MRHARACAGGVLLALGCGDVPDGNGEHLRTQRAPITGGALVSTLTHVAPYTSVVKIEITTPFLTARCTALKKGANMFYTAAHCVENGGTVGATLKVTNNLSGSFLEGNSYKRKIVSVDVHPSRKNYTNTIAFGIWPKHYDVARFTLDDTTPAIPSYPGVDFGHVGAGETVTYAGYGCDDIDPTHSGKKQRASFVLSNIFDLASVGLGLDYDAHNMAMVGDSPQGCAGDSGSPVWRSVNGTLKFVGVTVHGGIGYTGMARYGNVSNWFIDTAFGFSGFFLNKYTGRCITDSGTSARESNCDGRDQGNDIQWWTLSGTVTPNVFYIRNGSTGKCLDLETSANEAALVMRTCNAAAAPTNTQHWRFDPTNHSDYRLLVNAQTGRCTAPSNTGATSSVLRTYPCSTVNHGQGWMTHN